MLYVLSHKALYSILLLMYFYCIYPANDWNELQKSLKLGTYIFLSNNKHQLSEQLTNHCTCTQPICE